MQPSNLETTASMMLSYSLLLRMFQEGADAILVTDGEKILAVNRAAETMFGYHVSELISQPVEILVPEAVRERHQIHRQGYLDQPYHRPMGLGLALKGRHKDGHEFPIEINLMAFVETDGLRVAATVRRLQRKP